MATDIVGQTKPINGNNFDFCRFWLAIVVIFSHSFGVTQGDERNEPVGLLTSGQLGAGRIAVCCFFAISGLLITQSWMRSRSVTSYLVKRVLRIYPGFVVAVLIGLFVVAPIGSGQFEQSPHNLLVLLVNLATLRDCHVAHVFPNNPYPGLVNGSLWSIPYEVRCYLLLIVMGGIGLLGKYKRAMIPLLICLVAGSVVYRSRAVPILERGAFAAVFGRPSAWCVALPYFVMGTAFHVFRHRIRFSGPLAAIAVVAFAIASVLPPAGRVVFPFAITYLLFWFAYHPSVRLHEWSRYGDFSYGTYLYACPIQQLLALRLPGISPMMLFAIATPLSVMAGVVSWHVVEKYFLGLKHRSPVRHSPASPQLVEYTSPSPTT